MQYVGASTSSNMMDAKMNRHMQARRYYTLREAYNPPLPLGG